MNLARMTRLSSLLPFKREPKINEQIQIFLRWRDKKGLGSRNYGAWLFAFTKKTGIQDALDIHPQDIMGFLEHVKETRAGQYPHYEAEKVLRQFIRFYSARGKIMGNLREYNRLIDSHGVLMLAHIERNKEIVKKRLSDPKKWSWRKLGDYYDMHYTGVRYIFLRDRFRYGPRKKSAPLDLPV